MLKTSNLTLKRKQFSTPREGNPGKVLLTSRICLKYFYQWWHGRHEKCPTHNYVPALWLITPLVCHFCVQKEKNRKEKFSQHKHCTQKLALVQTWYNCASFESFIFRKLSQKSLSICLQNLKFFIFTMYFIEIFPFPVKTISH